MFEEENSSVEEGSPSWVSLRSFRQFLHRGERRLALKSSASRPKRELSIKIEEEEDEGESILSKTEKLPRGFQNRISQNEDLCGLNTMPEDKLNELFGANNKDYEAFFHQVEKIKSQCSSSRSKTPIQKHLSVGGSSNSTSAAQEYPNLRLERHKGAMTLRSQVSSQSSLATKVPTTASAVLTTSQSLHGKEDPPDFSFAGGQDKGGRSPVRAPERAVRKCGKSQRSECSGKPESLPTGGCSSQKSNASSTRSTHYNSSKNEVDLIQKLLREEQETVREKQKKIDTLKTYLLSKSSKSSVSSTPSEF